MTDVDWHWIRDTQLREIAHRYRGNGAGLMVVLRTAALNLLRLTVFDRSVLAPEGDAQHHGAAGVGHAAAGKRHCLIL